MRNNARVICAASCSLALASVAACSEQARSGSPEPSGSTSNAGATATATNAGLTSSTGGAPNAASVTATAETSSGMATTTSLSGTTESAAANATTTDGVTGSNGTASTGAATSGVSLTSGGSGGSDSDTSATASSTSRGGTACQVAVADPEDPPEALSLSGNLGTHDPVLIEADGVWYEFQTGPRILGKTSEDLQNWDGTPSALGDANPAWISERVPGATDLWAPDISFFEGQYHLYYSASTFGSNTSCIGHATRASLSSGNWSDQGPVICSENSDDYNSIDPNVIVDETGTPWLAFGSFWDGIKAIELTADGERANDDLHSLASRGGGAIEAPFIVRRCDYYYLFVSFDSCCQGADSTYNIRVGRSEDVLGPYVDQAGVGLMEGGGTQLLRGNDTWKGPGHNAVIFVGNDAYNVYHAYAASNGASTLRISELVWDAEGWPISGGP